MGNKSSSPMVPKLQDLYPLPKKYKHLTVLGEGASAVVLKCLDKDTKDKVAIKIAKASAVETEEEASILHTLMENKLDQKNIVQFHGGFWRNKCMVFEMLDIDLYAYLNQRNAPMCLQDIRAVMQQMATAFDALKSIGVIHADFKTDNIMLVDRAKRPFKVKLIDFGLAFFRFRAKHTKVVPVPDFRAPEIILGLPYSEAIDMWSLGCVMANMLFGFTLFPGRTNDELVYYITDLLGPAPDHMIAASSRSDRYYTKDADNQWIPKISKEYSEDGTTDRRPYSFRSLDEMKTMGPEEENTTEAAERAQCIELLKATLCWDDKVRITPQGILNHPFITRSYQSADSNTEEAAQISSNQTGTTKSTESFHADDKPIEVQSVPSAGAPTVKLPSGVILVQPAPPHRRSPLQETADAKSVRFTSTATSEDCNGKVILAHTDDNQNKGKKRQNGIKRFFS